MYHKNYIDNGNQQFGIPFKENKPNTNPESGYLTIDDGCGYSFCITNLKSIGSIPRSGEWKQRKSAIIFEIINFLYMKNNKILFSQWVLSCILTFLRKNDRNKKFCSCLPCYLFCKKESWQIAKFHNIHYKENCVICACAVSKPNTET